MSASIVITTSISAWIPSAASRHSTATAAKKAAIVKRRNYSCHSFPVLRMASIVALTSAFHALLLFYFSDGKHTFTDLACAEFAGAGAARAHSRLQIRDIRGTLCERQILDWSGCKIIVANTDGKTIFEAGFDFYW